jgi:hypothetical protein
MELPGGETSELGIPKTAMFIVAILYGLIVWLIFGRLKWFRWDSCLTSTAPEKRDDRCGPILLQKSVEAGREP